MENKSLLPTSKVTQELVPSFFPGSNLSLELVRLIFLILPIEDLERLWAVNCAWSILSKEVALNFYQSIFRESALWACLPLADLPANMDSLLPISYFQKFLSEPQLKKLRLENWGNLGRLINSQAFSPENLDNLLAGIDRNILASEEKYLIQQRRIGKELTITDFLKNSPPHWLTVARAYRHIETALSLSLLASFIFEDEASFNESICLLLDRRLTYGLTGSGLALLVAHTIQPKKLLLSHLIDFALGEGDLFLNCATEKQPVFQKTAQELLYRLTDHNYLALLGSQRLVLVGAIKRQCFPIIDSFGERALGRVIEENPDEEMLLVLLGRGALRLSQLLPSLGIEENFQKIVSHCSEFMAHLLSRLTLEQLRSMANSMSHARFFYLINGAPFLKFLETLQQNSNLQGEVPEKAIISTSSKIAPTDLLPKITCASRALLLSLAQLKSYFPDQIIKSQCIYYLLPTDILMFLKAYPGLWDILPIIELIRFNAQELLALAAINIKAAPCIVEKGYLVSKFTDLKDFVEFVLRYKDRMSGPLQDKCKEAADAHFKIWANTPGKEDTYTYIHWYILYPKEYPNLLDLIADDWLIQLSHQCQLGVHDTLLKKIVDIQNIKSTKKQIENSKKPNNPIVVTNVAQSNILKPSAPLALPPGVGHIPTSKQKKVQETTQPIPKQQLQNQENKKQNSNPSAIAICIFKGFFVGVLVTCIAILLLMFISYQMDVPLFEIINNLWIAGIIGAFAEVVATACFLVDSKGCESSSSEISKEADNPPPQQHSIQTQNTKVASTDAPSYRSKPLSTANRTADGSKFQTQQPPTQDSANSMNSVT